MFSPAFALGVMVFALLILSIKVRLDNRVIKERAWDGSETRPSPISEALTGLLGTAGGIYLSLVMTFSFMELKVPGKVEVFSVGIEPLAALSFTLAVIQPFVIRILSLRNKY
ncbi:MAG: hypothetical protein M1130_11150 [Actinobacteria bacterium]|nr:hypothetical protein [Actinomycetota bacterium]